MDGFISNLSAELVGGLILATISAIVGTCWRWPRIRRWVAARFLPPMSGTHFAVLVCELEHDSIDRKQTRHVIASLRSQFGVFEDYKAFEVRDYPGLLKLNAGGNFSDQKEEVQVKARKWLAEQNADVLIWGEVAREDAILRLNFVSREDFDLANSYTLTDKLELPLDFREHLSEAIAATVLLAAAPVFSASKSLVKLLLPLLPRLKNMVEHGPAELSASCFGSICNSAAITFCIYGQQSGTTMWHLDCERAFARTLEFFNIAEWPAEWSIAQSNYGSFLAMLAQDCGGDDAIRYAANAIDAMESALFVQTEKSTPLEWARSQGNLANAYRILAVHFKDERAIGYLKKSIDATSNALRVHVRANWPFDWAVNQLNLSIAFQELGKRGDAKTSQDLWEKSLLASTSSLEVLKIEQYPMQWAMAKSSLAATAGIIGQSYDGLPANALLHRCVAEFQDTFRVYSQNELPAYWAMNQHNLGNSLLVLGERIGDRSKFLMAIDAYEAALDFYKSSGNLNEVQRLQSSIGVAKTMFTGTVVT